MSLENWCPIVKNGNDTFSLTNTLFLKNGYLKGLSNEIFCLRFFSSFKPFFDFYKDFAELFEFFWVSYCAESVSPQYDTALSQSPRPRRLNVQRSSLSLYSQPRLLHSDSASTSSLWVHIKPHSPPTIVVAVFLVQ